MIDAELKRSLEAVRDGEIMAGHLVRPIFCDATRTLDTLMEEVWEARRLLCRAKEAFAMGWEPEFMKTEDDED